MKKKTNKTAIAMSIAVLTLALIGTACSNNANNANSSPSASSSVSASPSPSPSASEVIAETESPDASPETLSGTGEYVGLQDSHSVEITTEEGPTPFQVTPEIAEKVDPWEKGTPVKFQYTSETLDANGENVEQNIIISIEKR